MSQNILRVWHIRRLPLLSLSCQNANCKKVCPVPRSTSHFPSSLHRPQAMHPLTSWFPTRTISVSTPSASNTFLISSSAMEVFPSFRGLPLIINTFMLLPVIPSRPFEHHGCFSFLTLLWILLSADVHKQSPKRIFSEWIHLNIHRHILYHHFTTFS